MILITGGAGYIGSHINKLLSENGYETVVVDNLINGHAEAVKWGKLEIADLSDTERLKSLFDKYRFDTVFHFAAYAYVGESVEYPAKYYRNNVVNTINLLDAMREFQTKRIIFSSSCATYGIPASIPIKEDAPQNPINPYGRTKLMMEQLLRDYNEAYDIDYCCLRYFNAAGASPDGEIGEKHDPETHLIPLVLDAAADDSKSVNIYGTDYPTKDGSCIRDYIHVMDLAKAHTLAMDHLQYGNKSCCINLGNGAGVSVFEIINAVKRVTGKNVRVNISPRRQGDPPELVGSAELARELLGWEPQYPDIDTIIKHAWLWHEKSACLESRREECFLC
jgi:UDP-glucose 4-epimerase